MNQEKRMKSVIQLIRQWTQLWGDRAPWINDPAVYEDLEALLSHNISAEGVGMRQIIIDEDACGLSIFADFPLNILVRNFNSDDIAYARSAGDIPILVTPEGREYCGSFREQDEMTAEKIESEIELHRAQDKETRLLMKEKKTLNKRASSRAFNIFMIGIVVITLSWMATLFFIFTNLEDRLI